MVVQSKNSRMLTTAAVAHMLHVHPNSVRHLTNKGLLYVYRLGTRGDRRFKQEEVDNYIKSAIYKSWQFKGYLNREQPQLNIGRPRQNFLDNNFYEDNT